MKSIGLILMCLHLLVCGVYAADWTEWARLNDGALNGIAFSFKNDCPTTDNTMCNHWWQFKSNYETPVTVEYFIKWEDRSGMHEKRERVKLNPGENNLPEFTLTGLGLDEVRVNVIADPKLLDEARLETVAKQEQQALDKLQREEQKRLLAHAREEQLRQAEETRLAREEKNRQEEQEREDRRNAAERRERAQQEAREDKQRREQAETSQSWNNNYMELRNKLMNENRETLDALQRERQQLDNIQREKEEQKRTAEADRRRAERQEREVREDRERRQRKEEENRKQASLNKQRDEQDRTSKAQKEKEQAAARQEKDQQEKARLAKLEEERLTKERAEKERREKERLERERAKAEERAKQEKERQAAEATEKAAKQAYLAKIAAGARLQARTCPDGEGKYYLTGTYPQVSNKPVACVDISYRATCPGDVVGITGVATSFTGISTNCYMGDMVVLEPKPACPTNKVRVQVLSVTPCR